MPELESQAVPEDEPAVSISASMAEALDDEVLPFEARMGEGKSEVRSPESEVQSKQSGVRSPKSEVERHSEPRDSKPEVNGAGSVRLALSPAAEAV